MKVIAVFLSVIVFPVLLYADYTPGLDIFKAELQILRMPGRSRIKILNDIAQRYVQLAPEITIEYSNRALVLSRQFHDRNAQVTALSNIAAAYDALGYGNVALKYYQKALKTFSLYEAEKQRKDDFLIKTSAAVMGGVVLAFLFVIYLIRRYRRLYNAERIQRAEKQRRLQLESKLKLFQARTHPHFLFNSLDAIAGQKEEETPQRLKENVVKLARIYRAILQSPETEVTSLKKELEIVNDYLEIEKEILGGRLNYHIFINNDLLDCQVLPLTILTLVENAVKHGIEKKSEGGSIHIRIYQHNDALSIEVNDTGSGFDLDKVQYGFGIYSIQERLKLFYRNRAKLKLKSIVEGGTQAIMEVPYAQFQYGEN